MPTRWAEKEKRARLERFQKTMSISPVGRAAALIRPEMAKTEVAPGLSGLPEMCICNAAFRMAKKLGHMKRKTITVPASVSSYGFPHWRNVRMPTIRAGDPRSWRSTRAVMMRRE